ncbi:MAG: hypothetical protein ACQPRJ_00950 [Solitalea-like symbiont of Acarus siro]
MCLGKGGDLFTIIDRIYKGSLEEKYYNTDGGFYGYFLDASDVLREYPIFAILLSSSPTPTMNIFY